VREDRPTLITKSREARRGTGTDAGNGGRRRRPGRILAGTLAAVLIVVVLAGAGLFASRQVWFLGTDDAGRVALYQGLPWELPFGASLYSEKYSTIVQTGDLSPQRRDAVTGHSLRSKDDAVSLIEDIENNEGS
jgi:protein phosphatase